MDEIGIEAACGYVLGNSEKAGIMSRRLYKNAQNAHKT
jgi:hypothetical protein